MPEDAKAKARKAARRAQADFEQTSEKLEQRREARKAAFEKARAAGDTMHASQAHGPADSLGVSPPPSEEPTAPVGRHRPMRRKVDTEDKPIGAAEEGATTAAQDVKDRARVLREVLDLYPETLTLEELVRELTIDSVEFEERDRVQRAVRDLIAGGLSHRVGDLVLPTRAAVNFQELSED